MMRSVPGETLDDVMKLENEGREELRRTKSHHAKDNNAHGLQKENITRCDFLDFRKFPLLVAERACGTSLEPALYAVQMEHMTAISPSDAAPSMIWIPCRLSATYQRVRGLLMACNAVTAPHFEPRAPVGFAWYSMLGSYLQHAARQSRMQRLLMRTITQLMAGGKSSEAQATCRSGMTG
jgi:hypothetical protein